MMGHTCDLSTKEAKARPEERPYLKRRNKLSQRVATLLHKPCVLVTFLLGEPNTLTEKQLGKEEFSFSLPLQVTVHSGEKSRQEPELIARPHSITSDHGTHSTAIDGH